MNILIVESENDQYFVQALVAEVINSKTEVCRIDEFQHSSLDSKKLTTRMKDALTTRGVNKIGILLDMDDETEKDRITLVNSCLKNAVKDAFDIKLAIEITNVGEFISIPKDELITLQVACYFNKCRWKWGVRNGFKGNCYTRICFLQIVLMEGWKTCFVQKGKKIAGKRRTRVVILQKKKY